MTKNVLSLAVTAVLATPLVTHADLKLYAQII